MSDEKKKATEDRARVSEVDEKNIESFSGGFNPQPEPPGRPTRLGQDYRAEDQNPLAPNIGGKAVQR